LKSDLGIGYYDYQVNAHGDKAKPDRMSSYKPWVDFLKRTDGGVVVQQT